MSPGFIVSVMSGRLGLFGNFWHKLADQSSLEDQDKQHLSFFVIRLTVKYSDRLVATAVLKFSTSNAWRLWDLSLLRLCKILVRFLRFMLFSGHLLICFT